VKQDPEYLRNQSRYLHRLHRRNSRFARWFFLLWSLFFFGRFAFAVADVVGGFGWGFIRADIWDSLLFLAGGAGIWLFMSLIQSFVLANVRRTYGPEPAED
jgi:hypothetical protein